MISNAIRSSHQQKVLFAYKNGAFINANHLFYPDINGQSLSSVCMESMIPTDCVTLGADHQPNGKFQCLTLPFNQELEACTSASSFSYFSGSEVSFVITVIIEGLIVIGKLYI